jgi:hypothetical protein
MFQAQVSHHPFFLLAICYIAISLPSFHSVIIIIYSVIYTAPRVLVHSAWTPHGLCGVRVILRVCADSVQKLHEGGIEPGTEPIAAAGCLLYHCYCGLLWLAHLCHICNPWHNWEMC